ncbi:MAG: hypothetical protein KatS3mg059_1798 [Thermomicrobiales bacterium]|nr:MAG: hypothetical protein KatS3mg059_1786 [Thermomicrobiales bacterium]GIW05178.1 MAG: hypothetical protein KatS3mg059_1798 [Thermomicrobiales bacterium]
MATFYSTLSKAIWHAKRDRKAKLENGFYVYFREGVGFYVIDAWDVALIKAVVKPNDKMVASGCYDWNKWSVECYE